MIICEHYQAFFSFFAIALINLTILENELYDIKINLKSIFWCKNIKILSLGCAL